MPPKQLKEIQSGYRCLNYAIAEINISPDSIPNTIPAEYLKEWQAGDPDPYYKIQMIEYPILSNRINYQESFFKSFISKLKERPIPGSKAGHNMWWGARPETDFIMIGAKLESNGDGTGKVYFKNYIPPKGESGNNENFIIENKTDMVHYSLVSWPRTERYEDEEGNEITNAIESMKGERNDAVEYGLGGMKQTTNAGENEYNKGLDELSEGTISLPDLTDNKSKGEGNLTKEELLKKINALKENGDLTLPEIAESMGLKNQVVKSEHTEALKIVNAIKKLGMENPIEDIKALKEIIESDKEAVLNARLDKEFGTNPDAEDKENYLRMHAGNQIANIKGKDLEEKIENVKKDSITIKFAKERADYNTDVNTIGIVETTKKKVPVKTGRRIDKV